MVTEVPHSVNLLIVFQKIKKSAVRSEHSLNQMIDQLRISILLAAMIDSNHIWLV